MAKHLFDNGCFQVDKDLLGETLMEFNEEYSFEEDQLLALVLFLYWNDDAFASKLVKTLFGRTKLD